MLYRPCAAVLLSISLAAWGGVDDSAKTSTSEAPAVGQSRGQLIENPPPRIASISASELLTLAGGSAAGERLLELIAPPECGVDIHQLRYDTVDPAGQPTTASGALMIPTGGEFDCQGLRPIVVYAHGTKVERAYNIADLGNQDNVEGLLIALVFASRGYIVVAPNYAGLYASALPYHPFLNADQQSKDTSDALTAARSALPTSYAPTAADGGKLFITGYSQGGYVAMATHRLLQQTGIPVTASAPMSGPYALGAFGDAVFYGEVGLGAPLFAAYLATGYQHAYGDLYAAPTDMFEARYAAGIDSLLPTLGARSDLFSQGKLPPSQLFSSTPPDLAYAQYTPATSPADLAHVFALGFGPDNLVTNAFRLAYLQDAQLNPDGGFPAKSDGLPAANPLNALRRAFKANDLRNWTPTGPVLLCAGNEDPIVFYINTQLMQDYWSANNAPFARVLDLDGGIEFEDPDALRKAAFAAAKSAVAADAVARGAADGGAAAVSRAYHGALVGPFCFSAVQSFFGGF